MTGAESVSLLILLTQAAIHFSEQAQKISLLIQKAEMEKRAITEQEWKELLEADDMARALQVAQLAQRS